MARLSKPRRKKSASAPQAEEKKSKRSDIWLIMFIFLNLFILIFGYQSMDLPSLSMYGLLVLALISIYIKKRFDLSEKNEDYLEKFGLVTIIAAFVLFIYVAYQKFTAS